MSRAMTDREMLLLVYGVLQASDGVENPSLGDVIKMVDDHLWPDGHDGAMSAVRRVQFGTSDEGG